MLQALVAQGMMPSQSGQSFEVVICDGDFSYRTIIVTLDHDSENPDSDDSGSIDHDSAQSICAWATNAHIASLAAPAPSTVISVAYFIKRSGYVDSHYTQLQIPSGLGARGPPV